MKLLSAGVMFCLALVFLNSCKESKPPLIEICILDGYGGADCIEADGSKKYKAPSELLDYWSTNEVDQARFASWCYGAPVEEVKPKMDEIKKEATE